MAKYKLGDICEIVSGSTPKTGIDEYWDGNIKWITPAELNDDTYIITDSVRKITELAVKKTGLSSFPKGTVILSSRAPIGKVAIAGCEMYCNQGFKNLICSDKINSKYLYWFLKGNTAYLNSLGRGATFKEISKGIVSEIEINVPNIEKQEEAVATLEKISGIIALRKKELIVLDNLIKARFVEMFGECNNYELLGEADIFISDGNYSSKYPTADEFVTEGIPFIRASNMVDNTITDDEMYYISAEKHAELLKGHVKPNDVLIATRGAGIGKIAVVPEKHNDSNINAQIVLLRCNKDIYNPLYLSWYMKLQETQIKIQGLVSGSAQPQLPIKRLIQLTLLKPEIEMQNEFADFVHQVDKSKVVYMSIHKKLGKQKKQIKNKIA